MISNQKMASSILVALSTLALGYLVRSAIQHRQTHHVKLKKIQRREATQSWEGEGGAILERAPRPSA